MRPFRSFLLLFLLISCLAGLSFLLPGNNLVPPFQKLFPSVTKYLPQPEEVRKPVADSDSLPVTQPVQGLMPDSIISEKAVLESPLQTFLDSLNRSRRQVRIMYYGDSQIEGDRVTSMLRHNLRIDRGGTGPGLFLPLMPVMYTKSLWIRSSGNWKRYNYLSYKDKQIDHNRLGPFMAICRFLPPGDTAAKAEKAWVKVSPSQFADSAVSRFERLRILCSGTGLPLYIKVSSGKRIFLSDTLKSLNGVNDIGCDLHNAREVSIEFEGRVSPDIYGISIESANGIIVDNIPQRGSAGLEFTMVDENNLTEAFSFLKPNLIVLQYGLNIVRNVRTEYSFYTKGLGWQIERLHKAAPTASVLVVGVTDMAFSKGDTTESFSNIPLIIKAQKEAAEETGAQFWDSYTAMGGKSSVIEWSKRKPALAQNDLVHFTYPGADTLSGMLLGFILRQSVTDSLRAMPEKAPDTIPVPIAVTIPATKNIPEQTMLQKIAIDIFSFDPDRPMIFSTAAFWLFFLFVMLLYSMVYRKPVIRNFYLLLVSLYFYYKSGGLLLFLLLFVTLIDFTAGLLIHNSKRKFFRRLFIFLSLVSNLGILAYFKYTGFFTDSINSLLGTQIKLHDYLAVFSNLHFGTSFDINSIILPVGVSFFTFQSLSYTIDVYRRKLKPVTNIIDFGFYVSFFPQLVAGPIVRASEFIPQLYSKFSLSKREFGYALFLICKGLIKKIIISDYIAVNFVDRVFDLPSSYSGFENLMAVYGYGLQIYCDFSGYTDIAIGLGLLMGFRLPINFNSPYKASGITDFWRRWHISLSRWLKDYLYISLGGNRKGKFRTYLNLMITMLLGGLWHGASFRFIIWGGLHGIGLVFNKIWNSLFGYRFSSNRFGKAMGVFLTFNFVSFCWIFFRVPDLNSVFIMLKQITESFSPGSYLTVIPAYGSVFLLITAGYFVHFLPDSVKESYRGFFIRTPLVAKLAIILVIALLLLQMRTTDVTPFIYFRF